MASKIHSGGLLGGQAEKITFLKASRTAQGPLLGGHLGVHFLSEAVIEGLPTRNLYRRAFWNDFGSSWTPNLE